MGGVCLTANTSLAPPLLKGEKGHFWESHQKFILKLSKKKNHYYALVGLLLINRYSSMFWSDPFLFDFFIFYLRLVEIILDVCNYGMHSCM